ncbi:MAG: hypothetical protein ACLTDX_11385 [[Clostridium] innocuum]
MEKEEYAIEDIANKGRACPWNIKKASNVKSVILPDMTGCAKIEESDAEAER